MIEALTFDEVALVPQYSNVSSRTIPDCSTILVKGLNMKLPFLASNMDTVICEKLADVLIENGVIPILHRFDKFDNIAILVEKYKNNCFISCGLKDIDNTINLFDLGAIGICIDIAHGHSETMISFIKEFKSRRPNSKIIAGNVCTGIATEDLIMAGADCVKIGIGPGSACTTRVVTGFGSPQFSAIQDCYKVSSRHGIPLIADGGINYPRDISLSLAAGASCVMMGNLFSKTYESASEKRTVDGKVYGLYRGQASKNFQEDFYGEIRKGTVAEGVHFTVECKESAQDLLNRLAGALKSSLTYAGATNLEEFRRNAVFVKVNALSYMKESLPRD